VIRHLLHRATVPLAGLGTFSRPQIHQKYATVPSALDSSWLNRAASLKDQNRAAKTSTRLRPHRFRSLHAEAVTRESQ